MTRTKPDNIGTIANRLRAAGRVHAAQAVIRRAVYLGMAVFLYITVFMLVDRLAVLAHAGRAASLVLFAVIVLAAVLLSMRHLLRGYGLSVTVRRLQRKYYTDQSPAVVAEYVAQKHDYPYSPARVEQIARALCGDAAFGRGLRKSTRHGWLLTTAVIALTAFLAGVPLYIFAEAYALHALRLLRPMSRASELSLFRWRPPAEIVIAEPNEPVLLRMRARGRVKGAAYMVVRDPTGQDAAQITLHAVQTENQDAMIFETAFVFRQEGEYAYSCIADENQSDPVRITVGHRPRVESMQVRISEPDGETRNQNLNGEHALVSARAGSVITFEIRTRPSAAGVEIFENHQPQKRWTTAAKEAIVFSTPAAKDKTLNVRISHPRWQEIYTTRQFEIKVSGQAKTDEEPPASRKTRSDQADYREIYRQYKNLLEYRYSRGPDNTVVTDKEVRRIGDELDVFLEELRALRRMKSEDADQDSVNERLQMAEARKDYLRYRLETLAEDISRAGTGGLDEDDAELERCASTCAEALAGRQLTPADGENEGLAGTERAIAEALETLRTPDRDDSGEQEINARLMRRATALGEQLHRAAESGAPPERMAGLYEQMRECLERMRERGLLGREIFAEQAAGTDPNLMHEIGRTNPVYETFRRELSDEDILRAASRLFESALPAGPRVNLNPAQERGDIRYRAVEEAFYRHAAQLQGGGDGLR